jgi:putative IMPACT (imprinted ancient) family translation regulator
MLTVLVNSGIGDVVVVVTRYFGGIKLGRGGLVRAYGGSVQRVLNELPTAEHVEFAGLNVEVSYAAVDAVQKLITKYRGIVEKELFEASARFELLIPEGKAGEFEKAVLDATSGKAVVRKRSAG